MNRSVDVHHILFNRQEWTLRPDAESLREQTLLKPKMDREIHNELHRNCPPVPLLGYYALFRVHRDFEVGDDTFETIDNLLGAIELANKSPKSHSIERSLGELTIQAIDLQRPYIREGIR